MTPAQQAAWAAVQVRLRHGGSVPAAVENCRQRGLKIRVVRHYLGKPAAPGFGTSVDVSEEYGLTTPGVVGRAAAGQSTADP